MKHGVDISHHNKKVDFAKMKQDFIFIKATEGRSFVSPKWEEFCDKAEEKGISYGVYHYFKPGISPIDQAEHFCRHIRGDLAPVLDIEEFNGQSKDEVKNEIKVFLDYVEEFSKKPPIIYSGYSFVKDLKLPSSFKKYPLWLAWYTTIDKVKAPLPWTDWTYWQYSEKGKVEGISGVCDVNFYKGASCENPS